MRLTVCLRKQPIRWMLKNEWQRKGVFKMPVPFIPKAYQDKEIIDPVEEYITKRKRKMNWTPPDPRDPRYSPPPSMEDDKNYHETPVRLFQPTSKLSEGVRQAQILTKTQVLDGVPDAVRNLLGKVNVPDQDELCQRYIMQANRWDPTREKLPRRLNVHLPGWKFKAEVGIPKKRIASTLLRNLMRLCESCDAWHPGLLGSRLLLPDHYVSSDFYFKGETRILISGMLEAAVATDEPRPPFTDDTAVTASSSYQLPDLYPIKPTIQLIPEHVYHDIITSGFNEGRERDLHTLIFNNQGYWTIEAQQAQALLFLYSQALLQADLKYGVGTDLPRPISMQSLQTNGWDFHFTYFQLNTRDVTRSDGVKNLAWFDSNNALYRRVEPKRAMLRNTVFEDYDPTVLQKIIANFVYGANVVL